MLGLRTLVLQEEPTTHSWSEVQVPPVPVLPWHLNIRCTRHSSRSLHCRRTPWCRQIHCTCRGGRTCRRTDDMCGPLQVRAADAVPLAHFALAQVVPSAQSLHPPAPSQVPSRPQVEARSCEQLSRGSCSGGDHHALAKRGYKAARHADACAWALAAHTVGTVPTSAVFLCGACLTQWET